MSQPPDYQRLQLPEPPGRPNARRRNARRPHARRPHAGVRIFMRLLIPALLLIAICFMAGALGGWLTLPLFLN